MIAASGGSSSAALLRASALAMLVSAAACPSPGASDRQNTSIPVSAVDVPQAPTVPTTGAGRPLAQLCPSALPNR
ncbi:MAG TPA: hypothetical protein VGB85_14115, partial [Nannocystis sp.]